MTPEIFDELLKIGSKYNAALPFAPSVGAEYQNLLDGQRVPRIMFCGIATNGWNPVSRPYGEYTLPTHERETREWVDEYVLDEKLENINRGFWRVAKKLAYAILRSNKFKVEPTYSSVIPFIVWNNIWKIGGKTGNPSSALRRDQYELTKSALLSELAELNPNIVIVFAGDCEGRFGLMCDLFGQRDTWQQGISGSSRIWKTRYVGSNIYWTPRRAIKDEELIDTILNDLARNQNL